MKYSKTTTFILLAIMMFLMFFTWGSWYGQMGKYMFTTLKASGAQIGYAYSTLSIASIIAPFFVGLIADKYFSAQKVMGVLNVLGVVLLYFVTQETDVDKFNTLILLYLLTFAPNLALSSSIAMRHLSNPQGEFPYVRVFGTIAWIAAVNVIGFLGLGDKVDIFKLAMYSSAAWALVSFVLPNTPPNSNKDTSLASIIGADSFVLFKSRSFLVFFISSILVCIPLAFYYAHANLSLTESGMQNVENKMSLGQVSEVAFMLAIPFLLPKLGIKKIIAIGLIAWIVRFICFGYGTQDTEIVLLIGIVLHGVCYDFFFVSGQIYTDSKAGDKIKNSAQSLITLATFGIGMGIGSILAGKVLDLYAVKDQAETVISHINSKVWMVPAGIAAVVLVLFLLVFKDDSKESLVK
ncbi:MAG: MFS transporter [Leadbetterella sp.]